jgi:quercetin dioxygenase-like cupin family protein
MFSAGGDRPAGTLDVHDVDEEISYILAGEIIVGGPRGEAKAGAGACVKLPRGVWHGGDHEPHSPIWRAVRKARVEGPHATAERARIFTTGRVVLR